MKYLILNIAGIGDFFELIRWLYLLREQRPDAVIDIVVSDRVYNYAKRCPYVNNVYFLKSKKNHISALNFYGIISLISKLRKTEYDIIINTYENSFSGSFKMNLFISSLKKKKSTGLSHNKRKGFYDNVIYDDEIKSHYFYYKLIFEGLGVVDERINAGDIVWYDKGVIKRIDDILSHYKFKKIIIINPCGNTLNRRWFENRWAEVINRLNTNGDFLFVLSGLKKYYKYFDKIINSVEKKDLVLNFSSLTFDEWIYMVARADLVMTVDSAAMHLAALFNKKVVVISGPINPKRTEPYNSDNITLLYKKVFCSPCEYYSCPNKSINYMLCVDKITVDDVFDKSSKFLNF